ncbi:hypothetical protein FQR65_LT15183 [Abscondita terminalis]|nr:hypothetical protein FQR65_LT15183 [Abscondita terminalis]
MVSAAKLKRATNAIVQLRPYATKLRDILADVSASVEGNDSPFTKDREPNKVLLIVVSSNRGLAVQVLTAEQILPLLPSEDSKPKDKQPKEVDYIIEPSKEKIIEELIPKAIKTQLYKAILDSHASEHGARMTAMDKATENAGDLLKALKLSYNQARQAAITTELTEIVSGAAALSNG